MTLVIEGRQELTGIVIGDRWCLQDWELACEQPDSRSSRVLGGRCVQEGGVFIGAREEAKTEQNRRIKPR
jgi:hypothetical protein